jgi:hypothetical protein
VVSPWQTTDQGTAFFLLVPNSEEESRNLHGEDPVADSQATQKIQLGSAVQFPLTGILRQLRSPSHVYQRRPVRLRSATTAAVVLTGSMALAAPVSASASSAASASCGYGMVKVPSNIHSAPVATRPGQVVVMKTTIRNTSGIKLTSASIIQHVVPAKNHRGPAPTMSWRVGHGSWHKFYLTWHSVPKKSNLQPYWETNRGAIGTLAAHSVRALQVRIAFHRGDSKGIYFGSVLVNARGCGLDDLLVGGGGLDSFYS